MTLQLEPLAEPSELISIGISVLPIPMELVKTVWSESEEDKMIHMILDARLVWRDYWTIEPI